MNTREDPMKFSSALIYVVDFGDTKTFYCDKLGGKLVSEDEIRLVIRLGHLAIDFFQVDRATAPSTYALEPGITLVFQVEDVDTEVANLKAKGVRFNHETPNQNAYYRYAAFADPSGNVIEIVEKLNEL